MIEDNLRDDLRATLHAARELSDVDGLVGTLEDSINKAVNRRVQIRQKRMDRFHAFAPVALLLSIFFAMILTTTLAGRSSSPRTVTRVVVQRSIVTKIVTKRVVARAHTVVSQSVHQQVSAGLAQPPASATDVTIPDNGNLLYPAAQQVQQAVNWATWDNGDPYGNIQAADIVAQQAKDAADTVKNDYSLDSPDTQYVNDVDRLTSVLDDAQQHESSSGPSSDERAWIGGAISALVASSRSA